MISTRQLLATFTCLTATALLTITDAFSAPKFSKGTSIKGAIAYQDADVPSQFYYLPLSADVLLGERLKSFKVTHFGIGRSYFVQSASGEITSRVGAILSGVINVDLSDKQREELIAQIKKDFAIESPKLLPMVLRSPKITSTALDQTLSFGEGLEQNLPPTIQFGADLNYSIGSLNSGFGHIVAAQQVGSDITANPHFGFNVVGKAEFVGDPWIAKIHCDLSKVWSQVRSKASVSASVGWFRLGSATYSNIAQELKDSGACTFKMDEGSLDTTTYGRQVMDMTKKIFEAINQQATEGTGFFKFDTNYPQAEAIPSGGGGVGLFGFSVSVSGGYSSAYFKQSKEWNETVSYTGRFESEVAFGTTLAVNCGPETKQFFQDLGDAKESCVTQEKADLLRERLRREGAAKLKKYEELVAKLSANPPQITQEQYTALKALYDRLSLSEFVDGFVTYRVQNEAGADLVDPKMPALQFGLSEERLQELEAHAIQ